MQFGDFIKQKRMALGQSIRQFCTNYGFDSGNVSKMERGVLPPPFNRKKLDHYAKALRIRKGSDDYIKFVELAELGCQIHQFKAIFESSLNRAAVEKLGLLVQKLNSVGLSEHTLDNLIGGADKQSAAPTTEKPPKPQTSAQL